MAIFGYKMINLFQNWIFNLLTMININTYAHAISLKFVTSMCACNMYIHMGTRFIPIERNNEMKTNSKDLITVQNYCFRTYLD